MEHVKDHIIVRLKGGKEYKKFLLGEPLTRMEAMLAQCYVCNGEEESGVDCQGYSCPLYAYMPYKGRKGQIQEEDANGDLPEPPTHAGST